MYQSHWGPHLHGFVAHMFINNLLSLIRSEIWGLFFFFAESLPTLNQPSWICQLHLCRGIKPPPNECLGYGKAPVLELWGMWSTLSLPLLPGSLLPGVVVPVRVLSMGQIELFNHLLYLKPFNCVQAND